MAFKSKDLTLVSFVGQKGGVGKSALARVLATAAARGGQRVLLADFDLEQMTCIEWNAARLRNDIAPEIEVRAFKNLKRLRKAADGFQLAIADTRGFADEMTADIAEESDAVFLPTGTSADDLRPTLALARRLAKNGAARTITLILSRIGRSELRLQQALEQIAEAGFPALAVHWPARDGIQAEFDSGRAGSEARNPYLRAMGQAIESAMLARLTQVAQVG
jgi:chromosome partitioning protein